MSHLSHPKLRLPWKVLRANRSSHQRSLPQLFGGETEQRNPFRNSAKRRFTNRAGLTFIEVVLALSLTVVLIGLLGRYMGMHSRITETSKRNVRTTELATAIMSLIVEDIRGVQADYTVVTRNDAALEIPAAEFEEEAEETEEEEEEEGTEEEEITAEEPPIQVLPVGLYGTDVFLRMDTAKARRPGRRWSTTQSSANSASAAPIGELRTISYGMELPTSEEQLVGLLPPGRQVDLTQPILLRSSRDRAVSAFFTANLGGDDEQLFAQPLATEVASILFRYFDGTQWLTEWDSLVLGGLPLAVEITLVLNPSEEELARTPDITVLESDLTFRRTVQIPTARPLLQEDTL